jgi:hypothetical protein
LTLSHVWDLRDDSGEDLDARWFRWVTKDDRSVWVLDAPDGIRLSFPEVLLAWAPVVFERGNRK